MAAIAFLKKRDRLILKQQRQLKRISHFSRKTAIVIAPRLK
jgi:predicted transcriptional regulator